MDKFVIEKFIDGNMFSILNVEYNQRLLNEANLDSMTMGLERGLLFVRSIIDTTAGYFIEDDGRWGYGAREKAVNVIKRRL